MIVDNVIKGNSTTSCPTQPKIKQSDKKNQNKTQWNGLKKLLRVKELSKIGITNKNTIASTIKTTPPYLLGIVRNTA